MLFGGNPPLERGERRVIAVHAHPWTLLRAAWPLLALAASPLLYTVLDELAPPLRLALLFSLYLRLVAVASAVYALKFIALDLLAWTQRVWVLTDRRIIAQSGLLAIKRREISLLKVQESDYVSSGFMARILDIGDVEVETSSGLGAIVLRGVAHPRRLQALISAQERALRAGVARHRLADAPDEVVRQLEAVVGGLSSPHVARTEVVRPVSPRAVRAQQRLNLLPDEVVVAVARQHPVVLASGMIPPVMAGLVVLASILVLGPAVLPLAGAAIVILAAWAIWRAVTYLEHEYVLTTDRLMELRSTPLVFQMRDIVQLSAVQDVTLEIPTLFGRLADIGNVVVEVAGPDERVVLKAIGNPSEMQKVIFETIDARQRRQSERDDQHLASTLSRWFGEYHRLQRNEGGSDT